MKSLWLSASVSIDYKKERSNMREATTADKQLKKIYDSSVLHFDLAVRYLSNTYGYVIRACRIS